MLTLVPRFLSFPPVVSSSSTEWSGRAPVIRHDDMDTTSMSTLVKGNSCISRAHQAGRIFRGENTAYDPSAGKGKASVNIEGNGDTTAPAQGSKGGENSRSPVTIFTGGLTRESRREESYSSRRDEHSREDAAPTLTDIANNRTSSMFWSTTSVEEKREWEGEHGIVKNNQVPPGGEKRTASARIGDLWYKLPLSKLKIVVGEFPAIPHTRI